MEGDTVEMDLPSPFFGFWDSSGRLVVFLSGLIAAIVIFYGALSRASRFKQFFNGLLKQPSIEAAGPLPGGHPAVRAWSLDIAGRKVRLFPLFHCGPQLEIEARTPGELRLFHEDNFFAVFLGARPLFADAARGEPGHILALRRQSGPEAEVSLRQHLATPVVRAFVRRLHAESFRECRLGRDKVIIRWPYGKPDEVPDDWLESWVRAVAELEACLNP